MPTPYSKMTPEQRQKANARKEAWRQRNKDKVAIYKRKHYLANRQKYLTLERDRQYKVRYGIGLKDYDEMLLAQVGRCLICNSDKAGRNDQCFAVDHDHKTGEVRGLLCIGCNAKLGWYELNKASIGKYLLRS
jgi:hypothetical protein